MTTQMSTPTIVRQCGVRVPGVYAVSENSLPLNELLMCPPIPIDIEQFGLSPIGVKLIDASMYGFPGRWDFWDIMGADNYPLADAIVEARALGFSRRLGTTAKDMKKYFAIDEKTQKPKVTTDSEYILVGKMYINNAQDFYKKRLGIETCPKGHETHDDNSDFEPCLGLLWEAYPWERKASERIHTRKIAVGDFKAAYTPPGITPDLDYAIFCKFKIGAFEIVKDPVMGDDEILDALDTLGTNVPYYLMEE